MGMHTPEEHMNWGRGHNARSRKFHTTTTTTNLMPNTRINMVMSSLGAVAGAEGEEGGVGLGAAGVVPRYVPRVQPDHLDSY